MRLIVNCNSIVVDIIRYTVEVISVFFLSFFVVTRLFLMSTHQFFKKKFCHRDDGFKCEEYHSFVLEQLFLLVPEFVFSVRYLGKSCLLVKR